MANVSTNVSLEKKKERNKAYYLRNRERILARQAEYAKTHKVERNAKARERLSKTRDEINAYNRAYRKALREEVLAAYGAKCACCGEIEEAFLEIDHINGGGNKHRRDMGGGAKLYGWLKRNNWPKEFQLLCSNCNKAKYNRGMCPHEFKRLEGGIN